MQKLRNCSRKKERILLVSDWRIPLSDINFGMEENAAVSAVLERKWLTMGEEVQQFETEFSRYFNCKAAIAVSSGTAALHMAFLCLSIKAGDEIIQPAINFVAAANMTVAMGAMPIFGDILGFDEPTLDPSEIERLINEKTKAVVVMHYGGSLSRMQEIRSLCDMHGINLIEDACHAIGTKYVGPDEDWMNGKYAGTIGTIGCFSFFGNKNLAIGEGGILSTDRDDIANMAVLLRSHGMTSLTWDRHKGHAYSYDVQVHGYNYRLDEIRAALGRTQLSKLKIANERRRVLTRLYQRNLSGLNGWVIPFKDRFENSSCHLMTIVAPTASDRMRVANALKKERIQTSLHYPFIPEFTIFKNSSLSGLQKSRDFASRVITLPLYPGMSESQVNEVCSIIAENQ